MFGGIFWLLIFSGFLLYWLFDAFILQLSSKIVAGNKPNFLNAIGITGLVYWIELVIAFLAIVLAMGFMGRTAMADMLHSDIQSWFSFVPWILIYLLVSITLFAFLIGWLYSKMLRDIEGNEIGLWKGILIFLLQFVITRALLSLLAVARLYFFTTF